MVEWVNESIMQTVCKLVFLYKLGYELNLSLFCRIKSHCLYFLDNSVLVTGGRMTNFPTFIPSSKVNCVEQKWFIHLISSWYPSGNVWTLGPVWLPRTPGPIWLPRTLFHSMSIYVCQQLMMLLKITWINLYLWKQSLQMFHRSISFNTMDSLKGLECLQQWYFIGFPYLFFIIWRESQGTVFAE